VTQEPLFDDEDPGLAASPDAVLEDLRHMMITQLARGWTLADQQRAGELFTWLDNHLCDGGNLPVDWDPRWHSEVLGAWPSTPVRRHQDVHLPPLPGAAESNDTAPVRPPLPRTRSAAEDAASSKSGSSDGSETRDNGGG
jgi:hypothetical protein